MSRYPDIDPNDIDPDTGEPYPNYSSPSIEDRYVDYSDDFDEPQDNCTDPSGHKFECTGTQYGGDDQRWNGEGRCLCIHCGADGDA